MQVMRAVAPLLLIAVLAVLSGCGGREPPVRGADVRASGSAQADLPRVAVTAPRFGDADPHDWAKPQDRDGRRPESYPVHGIDTSRWQGEIDWRTARAAGVNFAFLKATEGGDHVDPAFIDSWRAAARAGVPRGAYHFWYFCRPAIEQARWFIRNVPRSAGALPPVLDMEWTPFSPTCRIRPPAAEVRAEAKRFLDAVERHYGQRPIIYATPDFFERNEMWRLGRYDFWLRSVAGHPKEVFGGQHWTFWQYTGTGIVPGIDAPTDINVFAGSRETWARWLAARRR
jgi:lysozyme